MVKSAAQVRRNEARAAKRGETYAPIDAATASPNEDVSEMNAKEKRSYKRKMVASEPSSTATEAETEDITKMNATSTATEAETEDITKMNAKERRSYKRKLESVQATNTNTDVSVLRSEKKQKQAEDDAAAELLRSQNKSKKEIEIKPHVSTNPLIVFVGQLAYTTTKQDLVSHIVSELSQQVADDVTSVRILTEPKTKKVSK